MFTDRALIHIKGGNGGNGCISFHRAKYVPNGGPDGGDGGDGGSVIFRASRDMISLSYFQQKRKFAAQNGEDGGSRNCSGKKGQDMIIKVPCGTVIFDEKTGRIMADMTEEGNEAVLIKGGRGGWGNQHYATAVRQAPRYAQRGKTAKEFDLRLELKLIADVGLIGFPNVGKSTLLSMVTNANPKIANYHFTTLSPNLGVVRMYSHEFIIADIPGLIEGASGGAGLGHEFLRHIERTKVLIHIVDAAGLEDVDPISGIEKINNELALYNSELLKRPQIIAANKMDIPEAAVNFERINAYCEAKGIPVFPISAAGNTGLEELIAKTSQILLCYPEDIVFEQEYEKYEDEKPVDDEPFTIEAKNGEFIVKGIGIEKMLGYTNIETEKGFAFFQRYLRDKGIIERLKEMGVSEGDTVRMYDLEFDYYE